MFQRLLSPQNSVTFSRIFLKRLDLKPCSRFINTGDKIISVVKVVARKVKEKPTTSETDFTSSYTHNVYITAFRAMDEYMLQYSDLCELTKIQRRSPYSAAKNLSVYLRSDVENLSKKKWGSLKRMENAKNIFNKSASKELLRYKIPTNHDNENSSKGMMFSGPGRVVMSAILINLINTVVKFYAWVVSGSHSMFSEFIHSIADTFNQVILALGIRQSLKSADSNHPYGFSNVKNIASLISGVSIFLFGSGMSMYHGINGIVNPTQLESLNTALAVLGITFLTEMTSLIYASKQLRTSAKKENVGFFSYLTNNQDPSSSVVFLEDGVSVLGVVTAFACIKLSLVLNSSIPDAIGSLLIGGMLSSVASFVIYKNTNLLVGQSIPPDDINALTKTLEEDRIIRAVHDVKATDMGNQWIRFKAEVDFDGRQVALKYLKDVDIDELYKEILKTTESTNQLESFMLKHGEKIVDVLGAEIDRIEKRLKTTNPKLRHVDIEQL